MKRSVYLGVCLNIIVSVLCSNVFLGEHSPDSKLIHRERVEFSAIPWQKRIKFFSYSDPKLRAIRAIDCYDYKRTEGSVNVTAGGIGFTYVTLRLKSQRSYPLDYAIEIFV